jgi:Fe-S-cluster containining protein
MALFFGTSELDFIQRFTRIRENRKGLALMDRVGGDCVFLEGNDCKVQAVKPQQCRDFPNLWNFPGFEKVCGAIPRLLGEEEYCRRIYGSKEV